MLTSKDWMAAITALSILCLGGLYAYSTWPPQEPRRCERLGGSYDLMGDCTRPS